MQFMGTGRSRDVVRNELKTASNWNSAVTLFQPQGQSFAVLPPASKRGQLPYNIKYGNTHGVCEDAQGHIYVHHTVHATSESLDTIVVFDESGKFVRSWGKQFKGGAHGLMLRKEGSEEFLYLSDFAHGIVTKRTLKGEEVFTLGYPVESSVYDKSRK